MSTACLIIYLIEHAELKPIRLLNSGEELCYDCSLLTKALNDKLWDFYYKCTCYMCKLVNDEHHHA